MGRENIQHYDNNEKNTILTQKQQFLHYSENYFSQSTIPG